MGITAREVVFRILGNTDSLVKGYDQAVKAEEEFRKKTEATNKVLGDIAKSAAVIVTAVAGLGLALGKMSLDFSRDFALVETLIPGATDRILELKKNVQDLAVVQGRSTSDLTNGLYQVVSAYGDVADNADQLALSARAAVAGASTTTDAINLLAAVTKGYGDTSLASQKKVADLAFVTTKVGQTTFPELARSIQEVVPLSKQLGVSLEEMFNVYTTGTGVIGGAAEVSTKYKAALVGLMKPTEDMATLYNRMGVSGGEALVAQFGFVGALEQIKKAAAAAGIPLGKLFESNEAVTLALSFTGAQAEAAKNNIDALNSSTGALDEAYQAATTGLNKYGFELGQAQQAATVFGQRLGDEVLKSTEGLLEPLADLTKELAGLDQETLATIVSIGKMVILASTGVGALALLQKAALGAKGAFEGLALFMRNNAIGIAVVGVVTAVSLLGDLTRANESATLASVKNAQAMQDQKAKGLEMAAQYESLQAKTNKTFLEQQKLGQIMDSLKRIYPELTDKIIAQAVEQGKLKDLVEATNRARNAPALKQLTDDKKRLEDDVVRFREEQRKAAEGEAKFTALANKMGKTEQGFLAQQDAAAQRVERINAEKAIDRRLQQLQTLQEKIDELNGTPVVPIAGSTSGTGDPAGGGGSGNGVKADSQGARLSALDALYSAQRAMAKKNGEDLLAFDSTYLEKRRDLIKSFVDEDIANKKTGDQSLASSLAGRPGATIGGELQTTLAQLQSIATKPIGTIGFSAEVQFKTSQGVGIEEALKSIRDEAARSAGDALDSIETQARAEADLRVRLAETNLTTEDRAKLEDYLARAVQAQIDLGLDRARALNVEATASAQLLSIDLERIGQTATKTEGAIAREIVLKKDLGQLGTTDAEIRSNELKLRATALQEKQNSLTDEYTNLVASSKDETNKAADADAQKAAALKIQLLVIAKALVGLNDQIKAIAEESPLETSFKALAASWSDLFKDGENKWKNFFSSLTGFAQAASDQIQKTFDGVRNIATGLIGNDAERRAQESNAKLTQLERDKNAALIELDAELTAMKRAHAEENAAIAQAAAEAEYQTKQRELDQSISSLQNSLDQETNIARAKDLEKQLEAARKTKREAQAAKQKEKDDQARAKKQLEEENAVLNKRAEQEWQFNVQKVNIENAAGTASANAAKSKAQWDKASTVLSLTLLAVKEVAESAAAAARLDPVGATLHGIAAGLAGVQAGVATGTPEPPGYTPQPLPPPPVFLAAGGIFLPREGGTATTTAAGRPAIVAEARVPEIYLPLTVPNLEAVFKAAGLSDGGQASPGFYYAPEYRFQFSQTDGTTKEEMFDYLKNVVSRDLFEVVEDARRRWQVGEKR